MANNSTQEVQVDAPVPIQEPPVPSLLNGEAATNNVIVPSLLNSSAPKNLQQFNMSQSSVEGASTAVLVDKNQLPNIADAKQGLDRVYEQDKTTTAADVSQAISDTVTDTSMSPEDRIIKAKEVAVGTPVNRSFGAIYSTLSFMSHKPAATVDELQHNMDVYVKDVENRQTILATLSTATDDVTDVDSAWEAYLEHPLDPVTTFVTLLGERVRAVDLDTPMDIGPAVDAFNDILDFSEGAKEFKQVAEELKAFVEATGRVVTEHGTDLTTQFASKGYFRSTKELVEFASLIPVDASQDIDAVGLVLELIEDQELSPKTVDSLAKRYGPQWEARMYAYFIKEVGVDAGMLFLASRNPSMAATLFPGATASMRSRWAAVMARATTVAVSGTTVEKALRDYIDQPIDVGAEVTMRFAGELFGEGLVKVASASLKAGVKSGVGLKNIFVDGAERIAKSRGLKVFDPTITNAVWDGTGYKSPMMALVVKASVATSASQDAKALAAKVAADVANGNSAASRPLVEGNPELLPLHASERVSVKAQPTREAVEAQIEIEKLEAKLKKTKSAKKKEELSASIEALKEASIETEITSGSKLADAILMGDAVGFRQIGEVTSRQSAVQNFWTVYSDAGNVVHRLPSLARAKGRSAIVNFKKIVGLAEAEHYDMGGVLADMFDSFNASARFSKNLQLTLVLATKGLNKESKSTVADVLHRGHDQETIFNPEQLNFMGLTAVEKDSYYASRKALDLAHLTLDGAMVKQLNAMGAKSYKGVPVNITKQMDANGKVAIKEIDKGTGKPLFTKSQVSMSELEDVISVVGVHKGYLPIRYKNRNFHVTRLNMDTGEVSRTHTMAKQSEALTVAQGKQAEETEGNVMWVASSWNADTASGNVRVPAAGVKVLDLTPEGKVDDVKSALQELRGALGDPKDLSDDNIIRVFDRLDMSTLKVNHIAARGERLKGADDVAAPLEETFESVANYMQEVAYQKSIGEWRVYAKQAFLDEYAGIVDLSKHWLDPNSILRNGDPRIPEARRLQKKMRNFISSRSTTEKYLDNMVQEIVTKTHAKFPRIADVFSLMPAFNLMNRQARGVTSMAKLGFFATSQLLVQSQQVVAAVAARPLYAAGGVSDFFKVLGDGIAGNTVKRGGNINAAPVSRALERSGYIADLSTTDIAENLTAGTNLMTNGYTSFRQGFGKLARSPFTAGEAINRIISFTTARREALSQLEKGTLTGVDGTPFKGDVDGDEFLRLVTDKAKATALDMTRAGQLNALSGFGASTFQFKQVYPKILNMFLTEKLTRGQKYRVAAMYFGLYGYVGLPLLADGISVIDNINNFFTDDPSSTDAFSLKLAEIGKDSIKILKETTPQEIQDMGFDPEFVGKIVSKGVVNATNEEINLVNRVSMGLFLTEAGKSMSPADFIPFVDLVLDLGDALDRMNIPQTILGFNEVAYKMTAYDMSMNAAIQSTYGDVEGLLPEYLTGRREGESVLLETAKQVGQVLPTIGHFGTVMENMSDDIDLPVPNLRDSSPIDTTRNFFVAGTDTRFLTDVPITADRLLQQMFGITPAKLIEFYDDRTRTMHMTSRFTDWYQVQKENFLTAGNVAHEKEILGETIRKMMSVQSMYVGMDLPDNILPTNIPSSVSSAFLAAKNKQSESNRNRR